jgi:N-acetylglucosaminyldiphosphoundecaprenol N-acetyl-beta-D-mannosaminyltransferase
MMDGSLNKVDFSGISIVDESMDTVLSIIKEMVFSKFSYVVTPNIDHCYRLEGGESAEFSEAYGMADLILCDSRIIRLLSRIFRDPIVNVVPGSDLTEAILSSHWAKCLNILIVGSSENDVNLIKDKFCLKQVSCYVPPMGFIKSVEEIDRCLDVISKSEANLIFLAVGSPQQEILAFNAKKKFVERLGVMLCVGASLDFLSGKARRAPKFLQKIGLEWAHRLFFEPSRMFSRYKKNFFWIIRFIGTRF